NLLRQPAHSLRLAPPPLLRRVPLPGGRPLLRIRRLDLPRALGLHRPGPALPGLRGAVLEAQHLPDAALLDPGLNLVPVAQHLAVTTHAGQHALVAGAALPDGAGRVVGGDVEGDEGYLLRLEDVLEADRGGEDLGRAGGEGG